MSRYSVSRKGYSHRDHKCECGETDPKNFYGKRKKACKKCFNKMLFKKRKNYQIEAIELLGGKCCRCGYNKCLSALEFHHEDLSKKEFGIGGSAKGRSKILEEAKKCILLCANCHREAHANLRAGSSDG